MNIHDLASPESCLVTRRRILLISQNVILYNNLRSKLAGTPFLAIFLDGFSEPCVYGFHIGLCSEEVFFCIVAKVCACVALSILTRAPQVVRIWIRMRAKKRKNVRKKQIFVRISVA